MNHRIKNFLKQKLDYKYFKLIKYYYLLLRSLPYGSNLNKLAEIYQCDKWGAHFYTSHYQAYFRKLKYKKIKLLEIGVGGYHHPHIGGSSLRMWKRYFPFGKIYALDIYDKSFVQENRIRIFQGSQVDEEVLENMMAEIGEPDIIIDDGSHINEHVIQTFQLLFPKLKDGGIYVIEDTQTSYWPGYGGSSEDLRHPGTMMNFFKNLTDGLNHQEFILPHYTPSYFDKNIRSIQFYHNLIFAFKGANDEPSNVDVMNPDNVEAEKIQVV